MIFPVEDFDKWVVLPSDQKKEVTESYLRHFVERGLARVTRPGILCFEFLMRAFHLTDSPDLPLQSKSEERAVEKEETRSINETWFSGCKGRPYLIVKVFSHSHTRC